MKIGQRNSMALAVTVLAVVTGCQSQETIREKYSDKLQKVKIGMPLSEFRQLFPKAYPAGEQGSTTVYAIKAYTRQATWGDKDWDRWSGKAAEQLHFYFVDGKLQQWGDPRDWKPDLDVQIRQR